MRKFAFIVLLLLVPSAVFAQNIDRDRRDDWRNRRYRSRHQNKFELTPFGGYRWGGTLYGETTGFRDDFDVASSGSFGANLGIPIGLGDMKLELMANRQNTHLELGGGLFNPNERVTDFDVSYYHAGLQIPLSNARDVQPFVVISAGVANLDLNVPGLSQETRFSASAGIGAKIPFNEHVGLRLEARGYFTSLDDGGDECFRCYNDYGRDLYQGETNVGIVISF
jgi:hypothetical protein